MTDTLPSPRIVSREEWLEAHTRHVAMEKGLTRARDRLSAQRRALPWTRIDKDYAFQGERGTVKLADLFGGRSQLIVKHFMFGPDWDEGCVGCSFEVDHIEGALTHLEHHDLSVVAVSRAPIEKLLRYRQRMGWHIPWVSSLESDFNYDFHVSFTPDQVAAGGIYYNYARRDIPMEELSGFSVFATDTAGDVFHTFSAFGRGAEEVIGSYMLLDMTPKGRNETGPNHDLTDWVRHHDRYGQGGHVDSTGRYRGDQTETSCCQPNGKEAV